MFTVRGITFDNEEEAKAFAEAYVKNPFMMERVMREKENEGFYAGVIGTTILASVGLVFGAILAKIF